MVLQRAVFLVLELSLLKLVCLLSVNHPQEVVALSLSLLGHHGLTLHKLSLASSLKLGSHFHGLFSGELLLAALLTLTLLERTFSTQRVDLCLAVCSLLLHLAETSDFSFLLLSSFALFFCLSCFTCCFILIVTDNHIFFIPLLLLDFFFLRQSNLVSCLNLGNQTSISLTLNFSLLDVVFFHYSDLFVKLLLLHLQQFSLSNAFTLTFLNLIDNNGCTLALSFLTNYFTFL